MGCESSKSDNSKIKTDSNPPNVIYLKTEICSS